MACSEDCASSMVLARAQRSTDEWRLPQSAVSLGVWTRAALGSVKPWILLEYIGVRFMSAALARSTATTGGGVCHYGQLTAAAALTSIASHHEFLARDAESKWRVGMTCSRGIGEAAPPGPALCIGV